VEPRLPEVGAPTLVVMGSKDPDFADPAAEAETVARLLRGTATMIEGAGHYPHAEMPETTASAVLAFLGREGAR
ncbi:MAG: alpha/beta hydrolase, partial [Bauldia sp.]|nr:alpha/beta hydrolase [Bauldia sp.]